MEVIQVFRSSLNHMEAIGHLAVRESQTDPCIELGYSGQINTRTMTSKQVLAGGRIAVARRTSRGGEYEWLIINYRPIAPSAASMKYDTKFAVCQIRLVGPMQQYILCQELQSEKVALYSFSCL